MLTIEELLERHKTVVKLITGREVVLYRQRRLEIWAKLLESKQEGLRKVPSLFNKLSTYRSEMPEDELELLDSLIAEQHKQEAEGNLSWTRISLHMDTLELLEKASKKKGISKSEVAEIAIREYCKSLSVE